MKGILLKESKILLKQRILWIDFAKGFTILLVIIGHCVSDGFYGGLLRGIIFSFHMPLFFILSSVTYQYSKTIEDYKKKLLYSARYLLTPAVITFGVCIVFQYINMHYSGGYSFWIGKLFTLIFASGVQTSYNGFNVDAMGIPWFFLALFLGRAIFDFIHLTYKENQKIFLSCCTLGMIGVLYGKIQWMPFSLDIALAILPFFFFGYQLKMMKPNKFPLQKMLMWGIVWLLTLAMTFTKNWTYMELAGRRYTLFPICYIAAIAGTMAVCEGALFYVNGRKLQLHLFFLEDILCICYVSIY